MSTLQYRVFLATLLNITYRYLITNYELSNFSVCQAKFEEGLPKQIVVTPSANITTEPHQSTRIGQHTIVGATVGTAAGVLFLIFILILVIRKVRGKSSRKNESEAIGSLKRFNGLGISNSVHEVDNNSLHRGCREIPDTGKAELLDENWPSGSGNNIQEMPSHSPPPVMHELMTNNVHPGIPMSEDHDSFKRVGVLASNWVSVVLSSAQRVSSRGTPQSLDHPLPSQPPNFASNQERTLATTPVSESPQVASARTSFSSQFTIQDYLNTLSNETSVTASLSGNVLPLPGSLIANTTEVHGRRERSFRRLSLVGLEVVIPPDFSGPTTSSSTSSSHGGRRRALANFF